MSKIVIIAGSNNKNLEVAKEFEKYISSKEVEAKVLDLVSLDLPLYTPDADQKGVPAEVQVYKEMLDKADGFVFTIPEYNGGIPPVVTNFIAWMSRSGKDWRESFNGKPAALASFSGGGGVQALVALRTQLAYIGLNTIGRQVIATFKQELKQDDLEAVSNLLLNSLA